MNLADLVRVITPSVVRVHSSTGSGTGFIYDSTGLAITNAHVIDSGTHVEVEFEGHILGARVLGRDDLADLAVVRLLSQKETYPTVSLARSSQIHPGEDIVVIGYPAGDVLVGSATVTRGIVSSKGRFESVSYLQTDAAINPGNSGGPMISYDGEVVGVVSSKLLQHGGDVVDGIGFAIDICEFTSRISQLELTPPIADKDVKSSSGREAWNCNYTLAIPQGWLPKSADEWNEFAFSTDDGSSWEPLAIGSEILAIIHRDPGVLDAEDIDDILRQFSKWVVIAALDYISSLDVAGLELELEKFRQEDFSFRYIVGCRNRSGALCDIVMCIFRDVIGNLESEVNVDIDVFTHPSSNSAETEVIAGAFDVLKM